MNLFWLCFSFFHVCLAYLFEVFGRSLNKQKKLSAFTCNVNSRKATLSVESWNTAQHDITAEIILAKELFKLHQHF